MLCFSFISPPGESSDLFDICPHVLQMSTRVKSSVLQSPQKWSALLSLTDNCPGLHMHKLQALLFLSVYPSFSQLITVIKQWELQSSRKVLCYCAHLHPMKNTNTPIFCTTRTQCQKVSCKREKAKANIKASTIKHYKQQERLVSIEWVAEKMTQGGKKKLKL